MQAHAINALSAAGRSSDSRAIAGNNAIEINFTAG